MLGEQRDRILQLVGSWAVSVMCAVPPPSHGTVPCSLRVHFSLAKTSVTTPSGASNRLMHRSPVRRQFVRTVRSSCPGTMVPFVKVIVQW